MKRFIAIDTETGGLDPEKHSLLTVGAVLFECDRENFTIVDETQFHLLRDTYVVSPGALKVNKLDLCNLPGKGLEEHEVAGFLAEFSISKRKPMIVAHNWGFDKGFLGRIRPDPLRQFGHRSVDTMSLMGGLLVAGEVKKTSLKSGCEYFGLGYSDKAHDALYDARQTAELFWELMQLQVKGIEVRYGAISGDND